MKTKLKQIIFEREIEQKELAVAAGVTPAAISYIINGKRTPRTDTARKIADFLGLPIDEIID